METTQGYPTGGSLVTHVGESLFNQRAGAQFEGAPPAGGMEWFAVQVAPQHEKKVATILAYKGHQHYFPIQTVTRKWSDRVKTLERPLFPNYVFCRVDPSALKPVLATAGVVRIVGFGGRPYPVREEEIEAIRQIVRAGWKTIAVARPKVGQRVQVVEGPLKGITGILSRINNQNHVVVSIEAIMRSVAVVVDAEMVMLTSNTRNDWP